MEADKMITILLGVLGTLGGIVAYFYKRIEVEHERDIAEYKERLDKRDAQITELHQTIQAMQVRLDSIYQRFIDKANGRL